LKVIRQPPFDGDEAGRRGVENGNAIVQLLVLQLLLLLCRP